MSITGAVKPGSDQHVAEIVHVGERVHARCARGGAQLLQRIGPERAEHQQALGRQHACELAQRGQRIRQPVQRHVAPDEIDRFGARAAGARRSAQTRAGLLSKQASFAAAQHAEREIERDHFGAADSACPERAARRAAAGVEDAPRRELHVVEALEHARADFRFQPRGFAVGRRRALETAPRRAPVNLGQARLPPPPRPRGCAGRSSPARTPSGRPARCPARWQGSDTRAAVEEIDQAD